MEFGYRAVFIAVPPTAPSVRSYVNRDTNAWKRKGLTDEKAEKGRGEFRAFETTSTTSVTLKIGKRGRREKKDNGKRERERELQRVNRQDSNEETSTHHFATLPVHAKRRLINESTRVPRPLSARKAAYCDTRNPRIYVSRVKRSALVYPRYKTLLYESASAAI